MKVFLSSLNKPSSYRQLPAADSSTRSAAPKTIPRLEEPEKNWTMLAKEAIERSQYNDPDASEAWLSLVDTFSRGNLDTRKIADFKLDDGTYLLSALVDFCFINENWDSCAIVMHRLQDGMYNDNAICLKHDQLVSTDGGGKQKGIHWDGDYAYRAGEMKENKLNGKGMYKCNPAYKTNTYRGNFVNGLEEGEGKEYHPVTGVLISSGRYHRGHMELKTNDNKPKPRFVSLSVLRNFFMNLGNKNGS